MKLVFLAPFGIRPKGTVIARMLPLASQLQALGHEVVIVVPPYTNPEDSGLVEIIEGVTVRNITLGPGGRAFIAPLLAWRMFSAMQEERPDAVHLFKPKGYGGLAAMLLLLLKKIGLRTPPFFVDTDDWEGKGGMNDLLPYSWAERTLFRFQEKWLLPRAVGVTAASRTLQTQVWGLGGAKERVLYLPNCVVDIPLEDGSQIRMKFDIPADAPVVLLYTRYFEFSQDKLHYLLRHIFVQLPSVRFLVVGKGSRGEEENLLKTADEEGFAPALVIAGWVEPLHIPKYLAAGDVAIYPFADNLVNRSKCPAKLTQLLLAACPVVADKVGQTDEYIKPGFSGILCDPDDWREMAENVVRLLKDSEKGRQLGEAGKRYLIERFNWKSYAEKLERFYIGGVEAGRR